MERDEQNDRTDRDGDEATLVSEVTVKSDRASDIEALRLSQKKARDNMMALLGTVRATPAFGIPAVRPEVKK